uniref:Uncharacterized protein n=1 Tax=Piliocolobus tephrosceles TaxID=591936 RepID=A0A8C9IU34_9PRIM
MIIELVCYYSLKDIHLYEAQAITTSKLLDTIQIPEGRAFYGFQMCMENIHNEVFASAFDTYIPNIEDKQKLHNKIIKIDSVCKKQEWLKSVYSTDMPYFKQLIIQYIIKIIFNGSLNILISYCKQNAIIPNFCSAYEKIYRDEHLQGDFAVMCANNLNNKLKNENVLDYFREAVDLEYQFCLDVLDLDLLEIKQEQIKQFLQYLADQMLVNLKMSKHFNAKYPFTWPEFVKVIVDETEKAEPVKSEDLYGKKDITFDEDF